MAFETVFGQERVKQILTSSLKRNRLAHAYLFHGCPGVGKDAMGIAIALSLICQEKVLGGCRQCSACLAVQRLEHPCFHFILPVPTRPKTMQEREYMDILRDRALQRIGNPYKAITYSPELSTLPIIGIDQVRLMKQEVILKVAGSGHRLFLVSQAEKLTLSAANSLLKLLEEPPPNTLIILTTSLPGQLLNTIVSRCQMIRFDTLQEEAIENALIQKWNVRQDRAKFFAKMAGGSLQTAFNFTEDGFEEKRQAALSFLSDSLDPDILNRLNGVEKLLNGRDRSELQFILQIILVLLRDLLHLKSENREMLINIDCLNHLKHIHTKWPQFDVETGMNGVEEAIDLIEKNVYLALVVTSLSQKFNGATAH
ncbi:hypothetical protein JW824_09030 [bacterium]|nr:hypothetical protein [bacterium]